MSAGRGGGCLIRTESWFCWKGVGWGVGGVTQLLPGSGFSWVGDHVRVGSGSGD